MTALLEVDGLKVAYGNIEALKGVTFAVEDGEVVTLIGSNGAGKTTTLRTVSGLLRPKEGRITFGGQEIHRLPPHTIVSLGLAHSPEGRRIFPRMTVLENLEMGAYSRRDGGAVRQDIDRVFDLFPILAERRTQAGGTLSGGEQQMLAIGRALMAKPRMLMLDEPSLGLAPLMVKRIFDTIKEINDAGTTILLVEQNAQQALARAHRGYVIETGRIVLSDDAAALLGNEAVRKAYLGEE